MTELLLHPHTQRDLQRLLKHPVQSLLINGKTGSGTSFVAEYMAKQLLETQSLEKHPYYFVIKDDGASISIESIRELQQFLKLRAATTKKGINRVIIIEKAARMSTEAQNALLKTLEEPPADSCIILTAQSTDELLTTITSRTQLLQILPVSEAHADDYFKSQNITHADFQRSYALSGGGAGLLTALINNTGSDLLTTVSLAKEIMAEPIGKRLLRSDVLAKDKTAVQPLLDGLYRICHAGLRASALKDSDRSVTQWQQREKHVLNAMLMHKKNANTKLMLDSLFINF